MLNKMGLESLTQRGRTPLYKDLVDLHQDVFDTLKEAHKPSQTEVSLTMKSLKYEARMKAIVFKHMGMKLSEVRIIPTIGLNAMCGLKFTSELFEKIDQKTLTLGLAMEEINRLYNDREGKLTNPKNKRFLYLVDLRLYTGWFNVRDDNGGFYFTAEELSAIVLHELGHIDHFTRQAFRMYGRITDASDLIDYIEANPHDRETVKTVIAAIKKSKYLNKEWLGMLKVTEEYFNQNNAFDDPYYWEALSTLTTLIAAETSSSNLLIFSSEVLGERNDRVDTRLKGIDHERSADEFTSRNGAYAAMTSMLVKMTKLDGERMDLTLKQVMWGGPAVALGLLAYGLSSFRISAEDIAFGYDPRIRRLKLIVETAKHAFSNTDLPEEVKDDLRHQIIQCEQFIAQGNASGDIKIRMKLKEWRDNVSKFGRIIKSPVSRMSKDYEKLHDANRSLSRNPLYYLAQR